MSTRTHEAGYVLDTDPARLDLAAVEQWLLREAYWTSGRDREVMERSLAGSTVYGLYAQSGAQVGVFRVVTDGATFAWLCDVFVDTGHRGLGLAQWAVTVIRDELQALGIRRIILATADAHGVYAKVGFTPMANPERWMELDTRPVIPTRAPRQVAA
ncbi:GNAT family N-acetyltransferase [Catellatospora sp. KI3]|uniref:GNAT family N-acetyltransferase n=1 Tax=Catellatospora sp. KI3 TaxID=3041620 RepID=UPI00248253B2|nr:GNAT family N-acetyltransferase [Catellatospora sp. KI3]MDI1462357.1 GNAT family N-acetyltransferase [Catellatospora sp. KI3]